MNALRRIDVEEERQSVQDSSIRNSQSGFMLPEKGPVVINIHGNVANLSLGNQSIRADLAHQDTGALGAVAMRERAAGIAVANKKVTMSKFFSNNVSPEAAWTRGQDLASGQIENAIRALPLPSHSDQLAAALELPEVRALVEAATPFVSPMLNTDYRRKLEALVSALAALGVKP